MPSMLIRRHVMESPDNIGGLTLREALWIHTVAIPDRETTNATGNL